MSATKIYSVTPNNPEHLDSSSNDYQRFGEKILDSSSALVGKVIGQVDVWCARSNTSVTGTITCNIRYGSSDGIAATIGSLDVSTIPQVSEFPNNPVTFGPNNNNTYALATGDKIVVEFSSGSSSNYIRVGENSNSPFDNNNHTTAVSYHNGYSTRSSDWAANLWTVPPTAPPPPPPSGGGGPTVGYLSNTAKDIAGNFWTIAVGTPPPPPPPTPPPPSVSPPPPPTISMFYNVPSPAVHSPRFLSSTGTAGSSQAFIRVGEIVNSSSSQMIGKVVKEVDFVIQKIGNPFGIANVIIRRGSDDFPMATMGFITTLSMTNSYKTYKFTNQNNRYALQKNDKILLEFFGGDKNNYISCDEDNNDPYDSKNSCSVYYTVARVYNINVSADVAANFWA